MSGPGLDRTRSQLRSSSAPVSTAEFAESRAATRSPWRGVSGQASTTFDETVMQPAHRRRRRRFVTAVVDVATGQILDVFEGRDAADLRRSVATMPSRWLAGIDVVSVDPHEGYRFAVCAPTSPLTGATVVVDGFHIVRLANMAVTRCRQRTQQATLEHRGWKGDPLYDIRKLLLLGAERVNEQGWVRLHRALRDGDPDGEVTDCWVAKEKIRDVDLTDDADHAAELLDDAIAGASHPSPAPSSDVWPRRPTVAARDPRPPRHRCFKRPGRSCEPAHQADQAVRARAPQHRQLPAPHPPRRLQQPPARNSTGHEHPTTPTQVGRVGPSNAPR